MPTRSPRPRSGPCRADTDADRNCHPPRRVPRRQVPGGSTTASLSATASRGTRFHRTGDFGPRRLCHTSVSTAARIAIASPLIVSKNVIIVGGGLAGLSAAVYQARAGRSVTIFERRRYLGGRAVTHLRHGYRFNLGPHAFYRNGHGWNVL